MKKPGLLLFIFFACYSCEVVAQDAPLPAFHVVNINHKILLTWQNAYPQNVTAINIQRSYDSLHNFSTIGTVLSAQSRANGYTDVNAPYDRMYYRIFISFEGGNYVFTAPQRPTRDTAAIKAVVENYSWIATPTVNPPLSPVLTEPVKPGVIFPSSRIFTNRDNNVVIAVPEAPTEAFSIKFYDENEKLILEIPFVKESFLIIQKENFVHSGWFHFDLYRGQELIETNRFQILHDRKSGY